MLSRNYLPFVFGLNIIKYHLNLNSLHVCIFIITKNSAKITVRKIHFFTNDF